MTSRTRSCETASEFDPKYWWTKWGAKTIKSGFGGTLGELAIIVVFGAVIGKLMVRRRAPDRPDEKRRQRDEIIKSNN